MSRDKKLRETVAEIGEVIGEMNNILPGCGEYQFVDAKSNKFWRVQPKFTNEPFGNYIVTWGRIGTSGQYQDVPRSTAAKRIQEKVAKGYEMVESWKTHAQRIEQAEAQKRVDKKRAEKKAQTTFLEELFKIS